MQNIELIDVFAIRIILYVAPSAQKMPIPATLDSRENVIKTIFDVNVYKLVLVPYGKNIDILKKLFKSELHNYLDFPWHFSALFFFEPCNLLCVWLSG